MKRYEDDEFNNDRRLSPAVLMTIALVSLGVLVVLAFVFASNNAFSGRNNLRNSQLLNPKETPTPKETAVDIAANYTKPDGTKDIDKLYKDGLLRAEDFDFWGLYGNSNDMVYDYNSITEDEDSVLNDDEENLEEDGLTSPKPSASPLNDLDNSSSQNSSTDSSTNKEVNIADMLEGENFIEGLPLSNMVITNIRIIDDKMGYYVDGKQTSKLGVDISEDSGLVDFDMLKNEGIDFVMICVGKRGYDSGVITRDANFERNIKGASDAGLKIGLYFNSRAVTTTEAVDEAVFCLNEADNYAITYPVAFVFDNNLMVASRTDNLSKDEKTKVCQAFLKEITQRGFKAVVYGNKKYLLEDLDPEKIVKDYDVWLSDLNGIPEYPYQFNMWKYQVEHVVNGIERNAAFTMSLVDYSQK